MTLFYLSFADSRLPRGSQFLGAVIVHADSFKGAVEQSHLLQTNPGGEVCGHRVMDPATQADVEIPVEFVAKLLTNDDLDRLEIWAAGLLS